MAITLAVEDGTGLADANCYCNLAFLETHAEYSGDDISSYTDEQKNSAIYVAANKYIDRLHEFDGNKVNDDQGMKLYTDLVSFDDASKDIMQANAEAAILQLKGFLFVSAETQSASGDVKVLATELDVLKKSTEYFENTSITTKYNTSTIDALLKQYLKAGSNGVKLVVM